MLEAEPWKKVEPWNTRIQQESIPPSHTPRLPSRQHPQPLPCKRNGHGKQLAPAPPSLQSPRTARLTQTMHIHGARWGGMQKQYHQTNLWIRQLPMLLITLSPISTTTMDDRRFMMKTGKLSVPSTFLPQTYRYTVPTTTVTETPTLFTFQRHTTQTSFCEAGRSVGCLFLRFHR